MALLMRPWGHDFCPPSEAFSGQDCASGPMLFIRSVVSTSGRQNSAILGANRLVGEPETWVLKVAARRGFFRMDSGLARIHPQKTPPCGHFWNPSF